MSFYIFIGHPIIGASWESFVIENILNTMPAGIEANFYRTSAGAEIDLMLSSAGEKVIAIAIKRSLSPRLSKGFHLACKDLDATRRLVIYPGEETYPLDENTSAIALRTLLESLHNL